MYTIKYNDTTAQSLGVKVTNRPAIPSAVENVELYDIKGRDGQLVKRLGTINDIEINVELNFITKPTNWVVKLQSVTSWLYGNSDMRLYLSDTQGFFFKVKNVTLSDVAREIREGGAFTATFLCDGYMYTEEGYEFLELTKVFNAYDICHPVYKIEGEGVCTLSVNDNEVVANVGQNITIDTDRKIAYREDGTINNTSISGDYEALYLSQGLNEIKITDGFTMRVQTNERARL